MDYKNILNSKHIQFSLLSVLFLAACSQGGGNSNSPAGNPLSQYDKPVAEPTSAPLTAQEKAQLKVLFKNAWKLSTATDVFPQENVVAEESSARKKDFIALLKRDCSIPTPAVSEQNPTTMEVGTTWSKQRKNVIVANQPNCPLEFQEDKQENFKVTDLQKNGNEITGMTIERTEKTMTKSNFVAGHGTESQIVSQSGGITATSISKSNADGNMTFARGFATGDSIVKLRDGSTRNWFLNASFSLDAQGGSGGTSKIASLISTKLDGKPVEIYKLETTVNEAQTTKYMLNSEVITKEQLTDIFDGLFE